jgi:hypothetical protein
MRNTVLPDAEYRSSGCGVPFLRMPKRLSKLTAKPRQYLISAFAKNVPNLFLIFFNQARSQFVYRNSKVRALTTSSRKGWTQRSQQGVKSGLAGMWVGKGLRNAATRLWCDFRTTCRQPMRASANAGLFASQ